MAAILKFCVARVIFLNKYPRGIFMQMLVLVSQFKRFFQLSAPLMEAFNDVKNMIYD